MSSNTIRFFLIKRHLIRSLILKALIIFEEYPQVSFKMPSVKCPRQSFTFEYKLRVIAQAAEIGNRAAAREFEIDESIIRYRKKKRDVMTKLPKRQHTCHTSHAKFPALERTLKDWVVSQRENSRAVTTMMIRLKAKELAKQMNVTEFVVGPSWCHRFMRRNRLSERSRNTVGQKLLSDWEEKVTNFRQFVSRRKDELNIQADHVFKMDEVPVSFDAPYSRTVDTTRAESIPLSTTSHEKTSFTVVLACSELGKKLKPIVIFKRKTMPNENLPAGVVVHCHNKGWMDRHGMALWGVQVWRATPVSFFDRTSLLIFDSFSAHIDEGVRNHFKAEHKTTTAVIPGGLTKKLQPLDISVNPSFKNHIREEWKKWMSQGIHTLTATPKMRRATHEEVSNWVIRAWRAVKVSSITNGFKKAGITNVLGGSEDGETDASSDDKQMEASATLDHVRDAHLIDLFNSDTEDKDFDGF